MTDVTDIQSNKQHMKQPLKHYTFEEIGQHKSKDDLWMVAKGRVYDVTEFLKLHPAHLERIWKNRYKDVTVDYKHHRPKQRDVWKRYLIGFVKNDVQKREENSGKCVLM